MSTEEYLQRSVELGIHRGSFVDGFKGEFPNVAIGKEPVVFKDGRRCVGRGPEPPMEDLTRLNPPTSNSTAMALRLRAKKRRDDQRSRA